MGSQKSKKSVAFLLFVIILFQAYLIGVAAVDDEVDVSAVVTQEDGVAVSSSSTEITCGAAGIEDGAVYAMQNVNSGLWVSTRGATDVAGISNVFQHSTWTNEYQTFTFEKTGTADNTYIIYTAETNTSGSKYALYCDYSSSASSTLNVYPKIYNASSSKSGYEWQVILQDGYIHAIRLHANSSYMLYVRGTTVGSESNTAASSVGNIIVRKSSSTTIVNQQKWRLVYVLPEGEYYIKNRGTSDFLHGSGSDVVTRDFSAANSQKWRLDHISNGKYQIYPSTASSIVYLTSAQDGGDVMLSGNNAQPSSMWYFERLAGGTFKVESVWTDSLNYDYALRPVSETNPTVMNGIYTADTERSDEWYVMSTAGKYGFQTFWDLDESLYTSVNCHGYAMQMEEWPSDWLVSTIDYYVANRQDYIDAQGNNQLCNQYKIGFHNAVESDFEAWLDEIIEITYEVEDDFADNGQSVTLAYNQYRVVMKTGYHVVYSYEGTSAITVFDYHFWYQTYDGSWVNKHGQGEPQRIESGMTPFSEESEGWVLEAMLWPLSETQNVRVNFGEDFYFYDSEVSSYIITIQ